MKQKREGQAYTLTKEDNEDPRATHVAVHRQHGFRYFCRLDQDDFTPQEGVADEDVPGTYYIVPCSKYGSCYNGCSLWQGGFQFIPLAEYY